ncbi:MAG: FG-GAP-like repeat-containing protein [Bacteroidales bacterium]
MKNYLLISCLFATAAMHAESVPFADMDMKLPKLQNCALAFFDYDRDGKMDLIMSGKSGTENITHLYHNSGTSFDKVENVPFSPYITSLVACADFDNDGYVDLFLAGSDGQSSYSTVYRNDNGSFKALDFAFEGVKSGYACWSDIDNDGFVDLIYTGTTNDNENKLFIYKNNNGVFELKTHELPGCKLGGVNMGDFDGDGFVDMIINGTNEGTKKISVVYKNDGAGNFELFDDKTLAGNSGAPILWADFNNDGKLDLLFPGTTSSLKTTVFLNGEDGFQKGQELIAGFVGCVTFVGDLSNNGFNDVVTTNSEVFINDGTTFTALNAGLDKVTLGKIAIADIDNDGKPDLLITGTTDSKPTRIYKNGFAADPIEVTAPMNLKSIDNGDGTVTLSWDRLNELNQHSYNFYLRNTKTDQLVFAPMADLASGLRYLPQAGNAGLNNRITIKLPNDETDWVWSVQAISHAFRSGPFAEEIKVSGNQSGDLENLKALPWEADFSDADLFAADWTIVDVDQNGKTWSYNSNKKCAEYTSVTKADDWLFTPPMTFGAGEHQFTFRYQTGSGRYAEQMDVTYGKSCNPADHTAIMASYEDLKTALSQEKEIKADIAEAGTYYVGFHLRSVDPWGLSLTQFKAQSNALVSLMPASDNAAVYYDTTTGTLVVADREVTRLQLFSSAGQLVLSEKGSVSAIPLGQFASGIYHVRYCKGDSYRGFSFIIR